MLTQYSRLDPDTCQQKLNFKKDLSKLNLKNMNLSKCTIKLKTEGKSRDLPRSITHVTDFIKHFPFIYLRRSSQMY